MSLQNHYGLQRPLSRRNFFERFSDGICGTALATLLSRDLYGTTLDSSSGLPDGHRRMYDLQPRPPHFAPKAKAVIHLFMNGGPSQMDLFDPKPVLDKHNGEAYFDKVAAEHYGYSVTHRRTVTFDKRERLWLIDDEFFGEGDHLYEARFHLAPGAAGLEISLLNHNIEPVLESQPVSRDYGEMRDAVSACLRISGRVSKLSWHIKSV